MGAHRAVSAVGSGCRPEVFLEKRVAAAGQGSARTVTLAPQHSCGRRGADSERRQRQGPHLLNVRLQPLQGTAPPVLVALAGAAAAASGFGAARSCSRSGGWAERTLSGAAASGFSGCTSSRNASLHGLCRSTKCESFRSSSLKHPWNSKRLLNSMQGPQIGTRMGICGSSATACGSWGASPQAHSGARPHRTAVGQRRVNTSAGPESARELQRPGVLCGQTET